MKAKAGCFVSGIEMLVLPSAACDREEKSSSHDGIFDSDRVEAQSEWRWQRGGAPASGGARTLARLGKGRPN